MDGISKELIAVNIAFGGACNKRCEYCLQAPETSNKKGDPDLFLKSFDRFVKDREIKSIQSFHYWGGEPLLYWDSIKTVCKGLIRSFPNCQKHRITTNGTLIHRDYVDFVNSHPSVITVVSLHDCDITDEQWRLIGEIKQLCLSALVSHKANSPFCMFSEWYRIKALTGRNLPIALNPIRATDGCDSSYWLTTEDVDRYFDAIEFELLPLANNENGYAKEVIANLVFQCKSSLKYPKMPKCYNDKILSLDLFGNRYFCHHNETTENRKENIFNKTIYLQKEDKFSKYFLSDECQSCEALGVCRGGCTYTHKHDVECHWEKRLWDFYKRLRTQ